MRDATPWLALIYLVAIGVALPFLWPDPLAKGYRPDGDPAPPAGSPVEPDGVAYDRAIHSRFFLFATAAFVCFMGAQVGGIAQLAKLGAERVDRATGALAVSVLALASVVARLVGGVVAARVPLVGMTAVLAAGQAAALAALAMAESSSALIVSAAMFGVTVGNLLMLQPLLVAEVFGVRDYPQIFSLNQLVVTVGVAGGPYLLGALHDASGYRLAYLVAMAVSLAGSVLLLAAGSVAKTKEALW
jgi:predicted MFS family arabinose efflux permease